MYIFHSQFYKQYVVIKHFAKSLHKMENVPRLLQV